MKLFIWGLEGQPSPPWGTPHLLEARREQGGFGWSQQEEKPPVCFSHGKPNIALMDPVGFPAGRKGTALIPWCKEWPKPPPETWCLIRWDWFRPGQAWRKVLTEKHRACLWDRAGRTWFVWLCKIKSERRCALSSVNTWVGKHQGQITAREATLKTVLL